MVSQQQTVEERQTLTLMELIRGLMEYGTDRGVKSFPPFNDRLWHVLLYNLSKNPGSCELLSRVIGGFDCGSYPKNRDLHQTMFGLRNICQERSFWDWRIALNPDLLRLAQSRFFSRDPRIDEAISIAFDRADKIQGFFER